MPEESVETSELQEKLNEALERAEEAGEERVLPRWTFQLSLSTAVIAVLITVLSGVHWVKEYSGHGRAWRTFLVSLGIVVAYYSVLLCWFWDMIPNT